MQNRYVGDVGDFAKYALLRFIARGSPNALRLAVIWYFYPDELHNSDGRHVSYLKSEAYRALDPKLHAAMNRLVSGAKRNIAEISKAGVLPPTTVFFEEATVELALRASSEERKAYRTQWFTRARAAVVGADLVFLDPDNGMEVRSVPKHSPKAGKYIFWDEVEALWAGGHSLLIYHHLNRTMTVGLQTKALMESFSQRLSGPKILLPLLFRRGSCRHFWIVAQAAHATKVQSGIDAVLSSSWSEYFEVA
jgi:hypothetical protein